MRVSAEDHGVSVKLAVTGAPGSGKAGILRAASSRLGAGPVESRYCGSTEVLRCHWKSDDGIEIALWALSGEADYGAMEELLVRGADGILFVIDVDREKIEGAWAALTALSQHTRRSGYELRAKPLVMQYHRAERHPNFEPEKLDRWLGVPTDQVPRFVTSSASPDRDGMAVDALVERVMRRCAERT